MIKMLNFCLPGDAFLRVLCHKDGPGEFGLCVVEFCRSNKQQ